MRTKILLLFALTLVPALLRAQPVITGQPVDQTVILGGSATFSVTATDVGPLTYQWQLNGTNLPKSLVTIVAGNGSTNYSGDGGAATNAGIGRPEGLSFDAIGNMYVAEYLNNRIRKVDTNGIITTVAGNGGPNFAGDGGAATTASLNPDGVTSDPSGNLYIADYKNNRIRFVNTNGIITTVAGNGRTGFLRDGYQATNNPYSSIYQPAGMALGNGGVWYIADEWNNRIRKIASNGVMTTAAGGGFNGGPNYGDGGAATNAQLNLPNCAALDAAGNLYIADQNHNRVRKVDTNNIITTVAGNGVFGYGGDGGAATNASLRTPLGLCLDTAGNMYIADYNNQQIRKVDTNGIITSVTGINTGFFYSPTGVALDAAGNLYVTQDGFNLIRKIDFAGSPNLPLNNVNIAKAGVYSVIVTSSSGSVTSSVATLTVMLPPITTVFMSDNGLLAFTWGAVSNLSYQLQCATNLAAPNWIDLGSPITATNSSVFATDALDSDGQRFYRVRLVP